MNVCSCVPCGEIVVHPTHCTPAPADQAQSWCSSITMSETDYLLCSNLQWFNLIPFMVASEGAILGSGSESPINISLRQYYIDHGWSPSIVCRKSVYRKMLTQLHQGIKVNLSSSNEQANATFTSCGRESNVGKYWCVSNSNVLVLLLLAVGEFMS